MSENKMKNFGSSTNENRILQFQLTKEESVSVEKPFK